MISILCPSRGRPEKFERMVRSIESTAASPYEVFCYLDADDVEKYSPLSWVTYLKSWRVPLGPGYNKLFESANGDVIMMGADDLIFRTRGWDTKVIESMPKDGIGVISYDDLGRPRRENGHPFIGRKLIDLMGYVCHPKLSHSCIDNWIVDLAKSVDRFFYLKDLVIEHMHPKYKKGEWDDTYEANTKDIKVRDGQFYKRDGQSEMKSTIARVRQYLDAEMVHRVG